MIRQMNYSICFLFLSLIHYQLAFAKVYDVEGKCEPNKNLLLVKEKIDNCTIWIDCTIKGQNIFLRCKFVNDKRLSTLKDRLTGEEITSVNFIPPKVLYTTRHSKNGRLTGKIFSMTEENGVKEIQSSDSGYYKFSDQGELILKKEVINSK